MWGRQGTTWYAFLYRVRDEAATTAQLSEVES
ncbi:MAG: hypothetical protein QOH97_4218 [Actinoplanes sp.]|jgi:hypothetical protein|nr:hypothetical protein [Actinoplanes sp.]